MTPIYLTLVMEMTLFMNIMAVDMILSNSEKVSQKMI